MALLTETIRENGAPLRVGVVGTGAMGRHHVRILKELPGTELVGICDSDAGVAGKVAAEHGTQCFEKLDPLAAEVDAVVLAVPTVEHARLGLRLLETGVHLLIEKPIASTVAEAQALVDAAGDRVLAVGHVEFYNPAVRALVELGLPPGFLEIHRMAAFKPRSLDIDVVLDLMIHDIQILHALDPSPIAEVRATGVNVLTRHVDIANVRIALESGCVANLTASRISAESIRKLRVFMPHCYYSLDYQAQTLSGVKLDADSPERQLVPVLPRVDPMEPLRGELEHFVAACRGERNTIVSGAAGLRALETACRIAEAIEDQPRPPRSKVEEAHV